jgi:signal transduction histidine kinase/integral membrane sensor domain MASE1
METDRSRLSWSTAKLNSASRTVILVCLVATLSYLAPKLAGALILHPGTVWPLWPGCALLVSVLLLVPQRIWTIVVLAAFAAFVLYDLQAGVPISSIAWFILADTVQVLTAAFCLRYFFDGVPRLNSVKALSKYLFFAALLAPFAAAFLSAFGIQGEYWTSWRISFLSEVLAFVTLTPAILGWVSHGPVWVRKSRAYHLEFAALITGLVLLSYITFTASESRSSPALLYSLVPFLLWAALRFRAMGVSTAVIVVAFLSIEGEVHGRGPFTSGGPFSGMLSLQLFLVFAATPFMVLAALVEERTQAEDELRESEERLRLAVQAGRMYAFEWDTVTDAIVRSGQCADILNWMDDPTRDTGRQFVARIYPDDREEYAATETGFTPENPTYQTRYRMLRPDGSVIWLEEIGRVFFDGQGGMLRTIGMVADITERKIGEEALSSVSRRLIEAQEQERARIARELHDDLSQRMALLQIGLTQFEQDTAGLSSKARQQLHDLAEVSTEVSSSIHDLSHQLHPFRLDTLGLVASLGGFCREFSNQHNLQVQFVHDDIPGQIPKEVTLCLFRIAQEALRNVVKHSGAAEAKVELSGHGDRIDLCVSDFGAGFSPASAKGEAGLGLISMAERLNLVDGHLSIDSQPERGTTIHALVPLSSGSVSTRAAGQSTEIVARSLGTNG